MGGNSYVYVVFRPDGAPCYVGQGRGNRWKTHLTRSHNRHLASIAKNANGTLPIVVIKENLSLDDAIETEIAFIAAIGREAHGGPLVNLTDGGEGTRGYIPSAAWRENRSQHALKMWADDDFKKSRRVAMAGNTHRRGKPQPESFSVQLSERMRGNQNTKGFRHSDGARERMRAKWQDPEWKAAVMAKRRETTYTPEVIAKRAAERKTRNMARRGEA